MPNEGQYATANMEWQSSCPNIAGVTGSAVSGGALEATVTAKAKGLSMVGVAYKNGGGMLGYILIQVVDQHSDSENSVSDIKEITNTLSDLIDPDRPSETDKKAVNAVADEVTKLAETAKKDLTEQDIKSLDELKQAVNSGLDIQIIKEAEGTPPQPEALSVVGAAIASGVDNGTVKVYVTPVAPTVSNTKLELKLEMNVNGGKEQLKAPLFFTMTLPGSVDVSRLTIKHITEKGAEKVPFTIVSGQTIAFKLDSFSTLQFNVANRGGGSSYTYYYIKATASPGGTISAPENGRVRAGETAGVTITPNKGYEIADLLVDGKSVGAENYYAFTNVQGDHTIHAVFKKIENLQTVVGYDDVKADDWFYQAVMEVTEKGWFNGVSETLFAPNMPTTRGMIATVLYRIEGEPGSKAADFDDVAEGAYYANGVAWAQQHGIVTGYGDGSYGPDDNITRQQLVAILYRYAKDKGYDVGKTASLDPFTDGGSTAGYAKEAMQWAVADGLISGRSNNMLEPGAQATRAEVAAILVRFEDIFAKESAEGK